PAPLVIARTWTSRSRAARSGAALFHQDRARRRRHGGRGVRVLELQLAHPLAALDHLVGRDADLADVLVGLLEMPLQLADAVVEPLDVLQQAADLDLDDAGLLAHADVLEHS